MIEIKCLSKIYGSGRKTVVRAVDRVDLKIEKGETVGLVGESGSGKSTLGKLILGLISPTSGEIYFEGKKKTTLLPQRIQMVFQDPSSSLNPRMTIESILSEPTQIHGMKNRVDELLELVGLPRDAKKRYPHEFSGGQRQRIGIGRALALQPDLLICDEPISALDVSIQAQIIHLLRQLQEELGLTLLFISHDLAIVRCLSTRIAVMHRGQIVETRSSEDLFSPPMHPYTGKLFSSMFSKPGSIRENASF